MAIFQGLRRDLSVQTAKLIGKLPFRPKANEKKLSLLVVSTTGYGDTLWTLPAIRKLRKMYPDAYIAGLGSELSSQFFDPCAYFDDVFIFKNRSARSLLSWPKLIYQLHQKNFDRAYVMHVSDSSVISICLMAQIKKLYGVKGRVKGYESCFHSLVDLQPDSIETRMRTIHANTYSQEEKNLFTPLFEKERKQVRQSLESIASQKVKVALQIDSRIAEKQWPFESFLRLAEKLLQERDVELFFCAGPENKEALIKAKEKLPAARISIDYAKSLRESVALLQEMDCVVTNDTGPMHAALAGHVQTVALFAVTGLQSCCHYLQKPYVHCLKKNSMEAITVEEVWNILRPLLQKKNLKSDCSKDL